MGKFYDEIPEWLFEWIQKQHMFWVASAPLSSQGHINVSPKGTAGCFHVVNSRQVWYEDLSGSGVETISHLRENGRITVMFSAFEGAPRILRLFGVGELEVTLLATGPTVLSVIGGTVYEYGTSRYNALIPTEARKPGSRAVIVVDVYQVGTSCGYAVPLYDFMTHRTQLLRVFDKYETGQRLLAASDSQEQSERQQVPLPDDLKAKSASPSRKTLGDYWLLKNMHSLDGLPGLVSAPDAILSMTPQSHFDKDTRPMMRHKEEVVNDPQWLMIGDHTGFTAGFVCGAVTMIGFAAVLGRLRL